MVILYGYINRRNGMKGMWSCEKKKGQELAEAIGVTERKSATGIRNRERV